MESVATSEPVAVYMPLGDGRSDAYRLVFAEHVEGQVYRLLEAQPADEAWRVPGATTVFAVEGEHPGRLVVVAPYAPVEDKLPPAADGRPGREVPLAVLRCALALGFAVAVGSILVGWCFLRPPIPLYPADPLRLGVIVSGAAVLWWARSVKAVRFSRGVVALLSIPPLLFVAAISVGAVFW